MTVEEDIREKTLHIDPRALDFIIWTARIGLALPFLAIAVLIIVVRFRWPEFSFFVLKDVPLEGFFVFACALVFLFFFDWHMAKKKRNYCVVAWENGDLSVRCGLNIADLKADGGKPVKVRKSDNGRFWILGEGSNWFRVRRVRVSAKWFPDLDRFCSEYWAECADAKGADAP